MSALNIILRASLCSALLAGACAAHAAPDVASRAGVATTTISSTASTDDLDKFLAERGFVAKIQQVSSDIVVSAMGFLGLPYTRGGNSFDTGFDCSGFVKALYAQTLGKVLPRSAAEQAAQTTTIEKAELQPGDLVFFNTMRRAFSHVGIYIGEGKFIHSPKPGAQVRIEDMNVAYWYKRYNGARRVEQEPVKN
jgi:cell wall-associated NlpC family hydrolase